MITIPAGWLTIDQVSHKFGVAQSAVMDAILHHRVWAMEVQLEGEKDLVWLIDEAEAILFFKEGREALVVSGDKFSC